MSKWYLDLAYLGIVFGTGVAMGRLNEIDETRKWQTIAKHWEAEYDKLQAERVVNRAEANDK